MRITVQFFSQLKEIAGVGDLALDLPEGATVADLLAQLYQRCPALEGWDRQILIGVGVDFVGREHILQPGEQVAIRPPVQGG